jgi:hypothetical protein
VLVSQAHRRLAWVCHLTSICPAYVADDTHVSLLRLGLRNLLFLSITHFLTWRIAAFNSIQLPRKCCTLDTHIRAPLRNQSKCRPSSTTRCRRRCEVSTSWNNPISTCFGGNTWRKRQQRVGYVAVEHIQVHTICDLFARLFAARDQRLRNTPLCAGVVQLQGGALRATGTKCSVSQMADHPSQVNARNAVASSLRSSTPSNPSDPTKSSHLKFSQTPKAWPFSLSSKPVS